MLLVLLLQGFALLQLLGVLPVLEGGGERRRAFLRLGRGQQLRLPERAPSAQFL